MKGTYCVVLELAEDRRIRVGAFGTHRFPAGVYAYVGSALSGIEQRVARHVRKVKKNRWHVDYLLGKGTVQSIIAIPSMDKGTECAVARALLASAGAKIVVKGFGSSDCRCESHLVYFGAEDPAWVSESVAKMIAMLSCVYPSRTDARRE